MGRKYKVNHIKATFYSFATFFFLFFSLKKCYLLVHFSLCLYYIIVICSTCEQNPFIRTTVNFFWGKSKVQCKIKAHYRKSKKSINSVYLYSLREYHTSCQRYSGDRETEHKLVNRETRWFQVVMGAMMKIKWGDVTESDWCVCMCTCTHFARTHDNQHSLIYQMKSAFYGI